MLQHNRRKARVLRNLKISEVSSVDRGAAEGAHVLLLKRASKRNEAVKQATARLAKSVGSIIADDSVDKNAMLAKTFSQFQEHLNKVMRRKNDYEFAVDPDGPINPGGAKPDDDPDADETDDERRDDDDKRGPRYAQVEISRRRENLQADFGRW
jgi:hypothetical protein